MINCINQGDILRIDGIRHLVLTVSKNFFNQQGEIIGCPIYKSDNEGPLHIHIKTRKIEGCVQCEKLALLDMKARRYSVTDRLDLPDVINITDAIQGIFDYV